MDNTEPINCSCNCHLKLYGYDPLDKFHKCCLQPFHLTVKPLLVDNTNNQSTDRQQIMEGEVLRAMGNLNNAVKEIVEILKSRHTPTSEAIELVKPTLSK